VKYTILGSNGFIGSSLYEYLSKKSENCICPPRNYIFNKKENLGHLIYCIGLTADFRDKPLETVNAHVTKLLEVLENSKFDSFLYLSSTRIYAGNDDGNENTSVKVNPSNFSDLYNISKLMGESICLSIPNKKIRIARLSNVIGNDFKSENFLFTLIKDAVDRHAIKISTPLNASKDYISIDDVVKLITLISVNGKQRLYNIASGQNIPNRKLLMEIKKHTNCVIENIQSTNGLIFPSISIERIQNEFSFKPKNILNDINTLLESYKKSKR
jgi:nucleoside-diphosphate-sugar epimerase